MIAELFLILKLLGDTVGDTPISPPPTTTLSQPVVIPPISPEQYTQWWLDATEGIPITSLPPRAR